MVSNCWYYFLECNFDLTKEGEEGSPFCNARHLSHTPNSSISWFISVMPPAACLDPDLINISRCRCIQGTSSGLPVLPFLLCPITTSSQRWGVEPWKSQLSRYGMTPWTNVYKTWGIDVITLQYVDTKWYKNTWVVLKVLVNVGNLTSWINKNVMRCQPRKPSRPGWSRPPYDCSVPLPVQGIQKRSFSGVKKNGVFFQSRPFPAVTISRFLTCHMKYKTKSPF